MGPLRWHAKCGHSVTAQGIRRNRNNTQHKIWVGSSAVPFWVSCVNNPPTACGSGRDCWKGPTLSPLRRPYMWPPRQSRPVPKIGCCLKGSAIRLMAMSLGGLGWKGAVWLILHFGEQCRHCQNIPAGTPLPKLAEYQPEIPRAQGLGATRKRISGRHPPKPLAKSQEQEFVLGPRDQTHFLARFGALDIILFCLCDGNVRGS